MTAGLERKRTLAGLLAGLLSAWAVAAEAPEEEGDELKARILEAGNAASDERRLALLREIEGSPPVSASLAA
ncbi:MAG: hypothetical protein HY721_34860 [Planctomycetes bacterium]|nr:hypothetical protein [Planctomycetota bacterium]